MKSIKISGINYKIEYVDKVSSDKTFSSFESCGDSTMARIESVPIPRIQINRHIKGKPMEKLLLMHEIIHGLGNQQDKPDRLTESQVCTLASHLIQVINDNGLDFRI